jgi:hypothetical protein
MSKRPADGLGALLSKQAKEMKRSATEASTRPAAQPRNPYLRRPVNPEEALFIFLGQVRNEALSHLPKGQSLPIKDVSYHTREYSVCLVLDKRVHSNCV